MKIEKPWCVFGYKWKLFGFGLIEKLNENTCYIKFSEK